MHRLATADREKIRVIRRELETVDLTARRTSLVPVLEPIRELLGTEMVFTHLPVQSLTGWQLENEHSVGVPRGFLERFRATLRDDRGEYAWYQPSRPVPRQRNRVIEALGAVRSQRPNYFEESVLYRKCYVPSGLERHRQLRVILCEGSSMLAWFGAYQLEPTTARQHMVMFAPSCRACGAGSSSSGSSTARFRRHTSA